MSGVFIYLDNSNIFHAAQDLAEERNGDMNARYRVRIHFENLLRLAHADRPLEMAKASGWIPPEMADLKNRMEYLGVEVHQYDQRIGDRGHPEVLDVWLLLRMLEDMFDHAETPGVLTLLSGNGAGYDRNTGFFKAVERVHRMGWRVEVLAWADYCHKEMREWVESNGVFVPLDDYYDAITYTTTPRTGQEPVPARDETALDLSNRPMA